MKEGEAQSALHHHPMPYWSFILWYAGLAITAGSLALEYTLARSRTQPARAAR